MTHKAQPAKAASEAARGRGGLLASFERWRGSGSAREMARMLWRKLVYRRVLLGIWAMSAEESRKPGPDTGLRFEVWGPDRYEAVRTSNPYLTDEDMDGFRRQRSRCIVTLDGDRIAGSVWATQGQVWVSELQRSVDVGPHEHFMRRGYSDPDYRGKALLAWMQYHYCRELPPHDRLWSATFPTNEPAVKTHEKVGRRRQGDIWSTYILGKQFSGQRAYPPRPLQRKDSTPAAKAGPGATDGPAPCE